MGTTKTANQLKPETTCNHPKPTTISQKPYKTTQKKPKTIQNHLKLLETNTILPKLAITSPTPTETPHPTAQ